MLANLISNDRVIILTGPAHLGKATFAKQYLEERVHPTDFLVMDSGIDGVRSVVEFCRAHPLNDGYRVILIEDAIQISEPGQDALLKLTEEPHSSMRIVMVVHDPGLLQPALQSRIRSRIVWSPLNQKEMLEFAESTTVDESLLNLASGMPGLYKTMIETVGFSDLHQIVIGALNGDVHFSVPTLVKELKGPGVIRDAVVHVLRLAARRALDRGRARSVLQLASNLARVPSISSDLHWQNMMASLIV